VVIDIVIVASSNEKLQTLVDELESTPEVHTGWARTSVEAIELASTSTHGLMIIDAQVGDKSGLDLAREVIMVNAGINMAVISDQPADEFHAASEGLGILAQLPPNPGISEAEQLLHLVEKL
jgi:DNA-binding response OmpR family regulator